MDSGMKLSTASNEAAKMYDAVISQFVGWYDCKELDGLGNTLEKMITADPEFSKTKKKKKNLQKDWT